MSKEEDTRRELVEELKQAEEAVAELRHLRDTAHTPLDWMERDLSLHRAETALESAREAVHEAERTRRGWGDDE
jgi:sugar-specific transcriptional regulator TrmB